MRLIPLLPLLALGAPLVFAQPAVDSPPALILRNEPEYSAEATRARVQSTVVLSIIVGEDGHARDVRVAEGAGFGLDEKAVEAIATWVFRPATKDGKPVPYPANVEMNFSLLVRNDPDDHTGQRARLNFTLPPGATRPELIAGRLPGNSKNPGEQSLRFHLEVDPQGVPKNVTVLSSNDPVWEKLVERVVGTWRFRPASVDGHAVAAEAVFEMDHSGPPAPPEPVVIQETDIDAAPAARHAPAPLAVAGLIPRAHHTATRLANGTVLLAGGSDGQELSSAQTFDWATRGIVRTGSMTTPRAHHAATLLPDGAVLVTGGEAGGHTLASAEIFDPSTGRFSPAGNMLQARSSHAAVLMKDGRVLICGGAQSTAAEIYDPRAKTFLPAGHMVAARPAIQAALLNDGRVLLVGGAGKSAEVFNPESGAFTAVGDMAAAANAAPGAAVLSDGKVLIVGSDAEIFDPASGTFHSTGATPIARDEYYALRVGDGRVLVTGGSAPAEIYDASSAAFSPGPRITAPAEGETATLLEDGGVLIAGRTAELITSIP